MKHNDDEKIVQETERSRADKEAPAQKDTKVGHEAQLAAGALWRSLSLGENTALSDEQSVEAAGMLGNQNVLSLIENGRRVQDTILSSQTAVDSAGLAKTLSGPPVGPVCDMGSVIGEG